MNSTDIYNIPEIKNIIHDYKEQIEYNILFKKVIDEISNINHSYNKTDTYIKQNYIKGEYYIGDIDNNDKFYYEQENKNKTYNIIKLIFKSLFVKCNLNIFYIFLYDNLYEKKWSFYKILGYYKKSNKKTFCIDCGNFVKSETFNYDVDNYKKCSKRIINNENTFMQYIILNSIDKNSKRRFKTKTENKTFGYNIKQKYNICLCRYTNHLIS